MKERNVMFTETDFRILDSYKSVLDGLAAYLGDGYEIVLHSLHDLDHSVIKIINGHYTGRREGFPITDPVSYTHLDVYKRQGMDPDRPACQITKPE